jgi:hypothetical protein
MSLSQWADQVECTLWWLINYCSCGSTSSNLKGELFSSSETPFNLLMWRCWTRIFLINASSYGGIFVYPITLFMKMQLSVISSPLSEVGSQRCWPELNTTHTEFFSGVSSVFSVRQKLFSSLSYWLTKLFLGRYFIDSVSTIRSPREVDYYKSYPVSSTICYPVCANWMQ